MNLYNIRNRIREMKSPIEETAKKHLSQFGINFRLVLSKHVVDRLFDRSLNIAADIENIRLLLDDFCENHLGRMMYKAKFSDKHLILYKNYRNNPKECLALPVTIEYQEEENTYLLVVRTFLPTATLTYVRERDNLRFIQRKKVRPVSDLQKMIYSESCPESLKILR